MRTINLARIPCVTVMDPGIPAPRGEPGGAPDPLEEVALPFGFKHKMNSSSGASGGWRLAAGAASAPVLNRCKA